MAKVNDIFVGIGGTAQGLISAIGSGVASIEGLVKSATTASGAMVALGAAVAGSAIVAGFSSFVKAGLDAADAQQEFADKLGVSVAGLSELHYAAKLSDTEAEALNNSLAKLGVNLANMDDKAGEGLKQLGLSFDDLKNDDLTSAFKKIVTAMGSVESPAQRAAIAMKLFGKSGIELRGLLAQGGDGLEKLIAEAHELGVVVSDIDGPKLAAAKDAIDKLESAVDGLKMQLAIGLAPVIQATAELMKEWLVSADFGQVAKDTDYWSAALGAVADVAYVLGKALQGCWIVAQTLTTGFWGVIALASEYFTLITGMGKDTTAMLKEIRTEAGKNLQASVDDFANWDLPSDNITSKIDEIKNSAEQAGGVGSKAIGSLNDSLSETSKEAEKATKSAQELIQKMKDDIRFHGLDANERKIAEMTEKLQKQEMKVTADTSEATQAIEQVKPVDESLRITADTTQATEAINRLTQPISGPAITVDNPEFQVLADTSDAIQKMQELYPNDPVLLKITAETSEATTAVDQLKQALDTPVKTSAADAFKAEADALNVKLKALEAEKKAIEELEQAAKKQAEEWKQQAEAVKEGLLTPMEKAQKEFEKLKNLWERGLLTNEEFGKATDKIDIEDKDKKKETQFAGAALAGSQEARDAILRHQNPEQDKSISIAKESLKVQRQLLVETKRREQRPYEAVELVSY